MVILIHLAASKVWTIFLNREEGYIKRFPKVWEAVVDLFVLFCKYPFFLFFYISMGGGLYHQSNQQDNSISPGEKSNVYIIKDC